MAHALPAAASAATITRRVLAGEVSAAETITAALDRIEAMDSTVGAFVHVDREGALASAARVDEAVRGGTGSVLAGVPVATTELYSSQPGWPSTLGGLPVLAERRGQDRSYFAERVESDGAVLLGFTNASPFGLPTVCDNMLFGPTRSPAAPISIAPGLNAGGAMGGSAAAVAAGMVPVAGVTDGGGWIRTAAAWCGVFGFQSSHGRVARPTRPSGFEVTPFAFDGAITRTVGDAALALSVLAGPDRRDPFCSAEELDWMSAQGRPVAGRTIGFCADAGGYAVDPVVAAAIAEAVTAFEDAGLRVVEINFDLPFAVEEIGALWRRAIGTRLAGSLAGMKARGIDLEGAHRDQVPDEVWETVEMARGADLGKVKRDMIARTAIYDALQRALSDVDLLACPAATALPVANSTKGATAMPKVVNGQSVDPLTGWTPGLLTNLTGHPSASLPVAAAGGVPVGLMLIGQRHGDLDLLAACGAFEAVRPWLSA